MTLAQLPVDILCEIFKFLPVEDIVRLTRVSRTLNEVIDGNRTVWLDAYRFTTLPRPLGPYSSQDTNDLKRILVRSAKVERNWPCLDLNSNDLHATAGGADRVYIPLSTRRLSFSSILIAEPVGDRWIVVVTRSEIWCVDLASEAPMGTPEHQDFQCTKLYECAANNVLSDHPFCLTTTDQEGCNVAYLVARVVSRVVREEENEEDNNDNEDEDDEEDERNSIYIFKLYLPREAGRGYMAAEFKGSMALGSGYLSKAILVSNLLLIHARIPNLPDRCWLVQTETDKIYQIKIPEQRGVTIIRSSPELHLCSTHILVTYTGIHHSYQVRHYIDVYRLPTLPAPIDCDDTSHISEVQLHLSHTGICSGYLFSEPVLWECSNPRNQEDAARIVLVGHRSLAHDNRVGGVVAAEVILRSSSEGVGTITCTLHDLFTLPSHPDRTPNLLSALFGWPKECFITMGGSKNRGVIGYSIPPVEDDVFGFTISIELQPDDSLRILACVERLQLPHAASHYFILRFGGNIGRIVRQCYTLEQAEGIVEVIDFA